jgi:hypothetical protein
MEIRRQWNNIFNGLKDYCYLEFYTKQIYPTRKKMKLGWMVYASSQAMWETHWEDHHSRPALAKPFTRSHLNRKRKKKAECGGTHTS